MQNFYLDYNHIYEKKSNINYNSDSDEEIIKKLNESRDEKKISKNTSALQLKGVNKNNILPIINTKNQHQNDNNLRYYH